MSGERSAGPAPTGAGPNEPAAPVAPDFHAIFKGLPGNYLVLAPDAPRFTMLAASDERLASTLSTRETTLGQPLFDVFSDANPENPEPSGVENLRASLDTVLRTRAPHLMAVQRYDLRRPDGAWEVRYWAPENVPILGADGAVRYIVHHVEDVTGRVLDRQATEVAERARQFAEVAESRLRDVLEQTTVAVAVLTGPEHVYSIVSPAYADSPGAGRPLLGRTVREAFAELVGTGYPETMDQVFQTGAPFSASERRVMLRNRDGALEERYFDVGYQPLRDAAGAVYAIASVAYDVTGQVHARRDAESARQAADDANQGRPSFSRR